MALTPKSTATIAQALSGISFPCGRGQIVDYARKNHADDQALDVLGKMPDERYESMADVFKGVTMAGHQPSRPAQPERAEGRTLPTEPPRPGWQEGQDEVARPRATQIPPQPQPEAEQASRPRATPRRQGFLARLRRRLGLG